MYDSNTLWQNDTPAPMPFPTDAKPQEAAENALAVHNRFRKPRQFANQQPRFKTICKRVRVMNSLNKRQYPQQLGDVIYALGDFDQSSVGASIGLTANGANASVGFSWGKIAMIGIPIAYLTWTMLLKKKGFGFPVIG
jgi:hypothetical protein